MSGLPMGHFYQAHPMGFPQNQQYEAGLFSVKDRNVF